MLGALRVTFVAFQEIEGKVLKIMRDEQQKRDQSENMKFGVEKKWEPPTKNTKAFEELEKNNPFA